MNVGILTYYNVCNFGANLQALSTYSYLKNHGINAVFINYRPETLVDYYNNNTNHDQRMVHEEFVRDFLSETSRCYTIKDVAEVIKLNNLDAIIVGSDAVLQHRPLLSRVVFPCKSIISVSGYTDDVMFPNPFWGCFSDYLDKDVKKAIMSASSQNSAYNLFGNRLKKLMSYQLSQFSYISARDQWTADMIKCITDNRVIPMVTPDPVFAFNFNVNNQRDENYIKKKFNIQGKYILLSFHPQFSLSEEWYHEFNAKCIGRGFECLALPYPQSDGIKYSCIKKIPLPLSPMDWYLLIKYSSGYVGNNMHPIVVSLHNGVPCYSFDNYGVAHLRLFVNKKSSKIYHIMNMFGVSNNRIGCLNPFHKTPRPEVVMEKLLNYDKEHVLHKAKYMYEVYSKMMSDILKSFGYE